MIFDNDTTEPGSCSRQLIQNNKQPNREDGPIMPAQVRPVDGCLMTLRKALGDNKASFFKPLTVVVIQILKQKDPEHVDDNMQRLFAVLTVIYSLIHVANAIHKAPQGSRLSHASVAAIVYPPVFAFFINAGPPLCNDIVTKYHLPRSALSWFNFANFWALFIIYALLSHYNVEKIFKRCLDSSGETLSNNPWSKLFIPTVIQTLFSTSLFLSHRKAISIDPTTMLQIDIGILFCFISCMYIEQECHVFKRLKDNLCHCTESPKEITVMTDVLVGNHPINEPGVSHSHN